MKEKEGKGGYKDKMKVFLVLVTLSLGVFYGRLMGHIFGKDLFMVLFYLTTTLLFLLTHFISELKQLKNNK